MTDLIRALCDQLLDGEDLSPKAIAARLGTVEHSQDDGQIDVVPFDTRFSKASVIPGRYIEHLSIIVLVPAVRLTLAELKEVLGPYQPATQFHPFGPRKHMFTPGRGASHSRYVNVFAEVSIDE